MNFTKKLITGICLLGLAQAAQAQRQLRCEEGQTCTITCYQDGIDVSKKMFHRDRIETLHIDANARVLKVELRQHRETPGTIDYFILGTEMSCAIKNMRGVHD